MYYLYVHTVPNGKKYIGMTKDTDLRWNNGNGYYKNEDFTKAIEMFGWENIKHEIIDVFEDELLCHMNEIIYTIVLNTELPAFGYNRTHFKDMFLKKYNEKKPYNEYNKESSEVAEKNIFEIYGKSYDAGEYMINQWIFNEKHRQIAKDKLLNGLKLDELSQKYNMSVSQIKRIVNSATTKLQEHM